MVSGFTKTLLNKRLQLFVTNKLHVQRTGLLSEPERPAPHSPKDKCENFDFFWNIDVYIKSKTMKLNGDQIKSLPTTI